MPKSDPIQPAFVFDDSRGSLELLPKTQPFYSTNHGGAYLGDALELLKQLPDESVSAVVTSPPYALQFQKEYGNASKDQYIEWFLPFAIEINRVLKKDGSFILNIGGSYNKGTPTRSLYHYKLLIELVEKVGFFLAQECFWFNPAKMPVPAEWVTVRRMRIRDSVEYVWWLSKSEWPKANNRNVLRPYSEDMKRLNERGLDEQQRPSGHNINPSFSEISAGGSIPTNVIEDDYLEIPDSMIKMGNNAANDIYTKKCKQSGIKPHPARFPAGLPEFFIKLVTESGDLVLDPFSGSNTTGFVAEKLGRKWISFEQVEEYIKAGQFRF